MGGPGLTAAGTSWQTAVMLEPGMYILECFVKDRNEEFHSYNGMLEMLTVTDAASGAREPVAAAAVELSSWDGIRIADNTRPGMQTVAIRFLDQRTYEQLQGQNAHLVRLSGTEPALLDALGAWMGGAPPRSGSLGTWVGRRRPPGRTLPRPFPPPGDHRSPSFAAPSPAVEAEMVDPPRAVGEPRHPTRVVPDEAHKGQPREGVLVDGLQLELA